MALQHDIAGTVAIGIGATALMDIWLGVLKRLRVRTLNFALLGRWVGHLWRGRLVHADIARAAPIRGELAWGWFSHYAVGVAFAAALVGLLGPAWTRQPTPAPALLFGIGSVLLPLFVMQPAMGAGIAASRTPAPLLNCLRSLAGHAVFGLGLYLSAAAVAVGAR